MKNGKPNFKQLPCKNKEARIRSVYLRHGYRLKKFGRETVEKSIGKFALACRSLRCEFCEAFHGALNRLRHDGSGQPN